MKKGRYILGVLCCFMSTILLHYLMALLISTMIYMRRLEFIDWIIILLTFTVGFGVLSFLYSVAIAHPAVKDEYEINSYLANAKRFKFEDTFVIYALVLFLVSQALFMLSGILSLSLLQGAGGYFEEIFEGDALAMVVLWSLPSELTLKGVHAAWYIGTSATEEMVNGNGLFIWFTVLHVIAVTCISLVMWERIIDTLKSNWMQKLEKRKKKVK